MVSFYMSGKVNGDPLSEHLPILVTHIDGSPDNLAQTQQNVLSGGHHKINLNTVRVTGGSCRQEGLSRGGMLAYLILSND